MNAQSFNALMNQQVRRLTLRQRELLKKRLDELDEQQREPELPKAPCNMLAC